MAEVLFKGKRIKDGKWIYGDFKLSKDCRFCLGGTDEDCEVYANTIKPFTGATDRNGAKVFEGDIVYWSKYDKYLIVRWFQCFYTLVGKNCHPNYSKEFISKLEVVGNEFDNYNLIKDIYEG